MNFHKGDYVAAPDLIPPLKLGEILETNGTICPWYKVLELQNDGTVGPRMLNLYEPNLKLVAWVKDKRVSIYATC